MPSLADEHPAAAHTETGCVNGYELFFLLSLSLSLFLFLTSAVYNLASYLFCSDVEVVERHYPSRLRFEQDTET